MNRVFVSYSRRNKIFAERIARDLGDAGMEVWIDFRQIHGGEQWQDEIYRGIERSQIVVVCLSPDAVKSDWVQREVLTARKQEKFIIPVMAVNAQHELEQAEELSWMQNVHFINFEGRYEEALPELLLAIPGKRRLGIYDSVDPNNIPNPFKGLEAFQQTDAAFFFGRETLIDKCLNRLRQDRPTRFLAVVGASGSGKSSLVRAGVLPALRAGKLRGSDSWRIILFTPGSSPIEALSQRLAPLLEGQEAEKLSKLFHESIEYLQPFVAQVLRDAPPEAKMVMVIDQFEEVFTRAGEHDRELFLRLLHLAVTQKGGRISVIITMRADFFDRLSRYPALAELFEQENMVIATEMSPAELLRAIEGPARAVGLTYDPPNLAQRILDDVVRQPGSLPLLQYALKELYLRRDGLKLTTKAYEEIGGVQKALARHAEDIYNDLNAAQQAIMRRLLLRLIEVSETGEATRRRVDRADLTFRDVPPQAVEELIEILTSADTRLILTNFQIHPNSAQSAPTILVDIGHEALIREWDRFKGWVAEDKENLRLGSEILQYATDWASAKRDKAYLIMGNRLARAEIWLDEADATTLQREFIQASIKENEERERLERERLERELVLRRRSQNRLRIALSFLAIGLLASLILSLIAVGAQAQAVSAEQQARDALAGAEIARAEAVANELQARSLALASNAGRALSDNLNEQAVLLAVSANEIPNAPPQSQRILAEVAYTPGTRFLFDMNGVPISTLAISPDASLVAGGVGNTIIVWNSETGEEAFRLTGTSLVGHTNRVRGVVFHPTEALIASVGADGRVVIWDIATQAQSIRWDAHSGGANTIAFDKDGQFLLTGGEDRQISLWNPFTGELIRTYTGHSGAVNSVAFNNDSTLFASGSDDDRVGIWSLTDGFIKFLSGHAGDVLTVIFSPTAASRLLSGSDDDTIRLWDALNTSVTREYIQHNDAVTGLAFFPDGRNFISISQDTSMIVWDVTTGTTTNSFNDHEAPVFAIALSKDGQMMASGADNGIARVWDLKNSEQTMTFAGHLSNDARFRAVVGVYGRDDLTVLSGSYDGTLRLWATATGLTIQEFRGHADLVFDVALSSDETTALSGGADDKAILWDIITGAPIIELIGHESDVLSVAYLPNNQQAITGDENGIIILWDLTTGQDVRRFEKVGKDDLGHTAQVYDIAVSPDGTRILSASADQNLLLWDIATATVLGEYKGHGAIIRSVAFNSDGTLAVSGADNGGIILWNVSDESLNARDRVVRRISGHDLPVRGVTFSPDDLSIASGGLDRRLSVWEVATGAEIRRYRTTNLSSFYSVDFNRTGQALLTGMSDGTLHEWRLLLNRQDLLAWTYENRYVPIPTCAQREQFGLEPFCEDGVSNITPTPFVFPTVTPAPSLPSVDVGVTVAINTTSNSNLRLRENPSLTGNTIMMLADGILAMVIEGPVEAEGFIWWKIRLEDNTEGWSAESNPTAGVQMLIPLR
ncbi:MAG: TIR domain-containing protein [Phototrophicales bacterium]|nr:TIR domain-containing protein [Phototrophicales bacterium]